MSRYALLLLPVLAFAQAVPNSVTVTASRNTTVQPDQAVLSVFADAPITSTLDDALAALQGSGITSANFAGVGTTQIFSNQQTQTLLEWRFTLVTDLSNLKTTLTGLSAIQQNVAKQKNGMSVGISVQGTQVSQKQAQTQPCSLSDLMADARAQASKLASAASMTVGGVLAVSGGTTTTATGAGGNALSSVVSLPVCSLTVRFALGGGF